jgi:hypothetical protein
MIESPAWVKLEERIDDHARRLKLLEARQAAYDTVLSVFRWAGPIVVGIAGVVVGKLL